MILFDKPCKKMTVRDWENHPACNLMYNIDLTIWIQLEVMTDEEKAAHPFHETTGGYFRTITMKEAWANFWGNLSEENRKHFTTLENFDVDKFEQITGIRI